MQDYWNNRYIHGGISGKGSIGILRAWKWNIITQYADIDNTSIIDVGCGDLSFWSNKLATRLKPYTGIDFSKYIINQHTTTFKDLASVCFIHADASKRISNLKADIVFCFDVLFHILDRKIYLQILNNLCTYANDLIFIYTWIKNPFTSMNRRIDLLRQLKVYSFFKTIHQVSDSYQKYYNFELYISFFEKYGFQLIGVESNININPFGAMFIFKSNNPMIR